MRNFLALIPFSSLLLCTIQIQCISSSTNMNQNDEQEFYCTQGFGIQSSSSSTTTTTTTKTKIKIEPNQINDGYCDCPYENGIDEYETDACSGSTHWAGIGSSSSSTENDDDDDDDNDDNKEKQQELKMVCPKQPKLQLSLSKINDSICDCCDGYDEQQSQYLHQTCEHVKPSK